MLTNVEQIRDLNLEKESLNARKEAIKKKALEHRNAVTDAEIEASKQEVLDLNNQIQDIDKRIQKLQKEDNIVNMEFQRTIDTQRLERATAFAQAQREAISADEVRSVLLATGGIAKPEKLSGINDGFPNKITIVDLVTVEDATGCGSYKEVYQKSIQEASEKTDGVAQDGSDPKWGSVTITPTLLATTSYVSRELAKQTPLNYYDRVVSGALSALKVKLADWILNGYSTKFKGMKNTKNDDDVPADMFTTYEVNTNKVDASFLRDLVLNYGGDANAYGGTGWLLLNKKDLIALGDVRGTNEKKALYEITPDPNNPNIGTIKEGGFIVNYCLCPSLTSLTASTVPTDTKKIQTMIYGVTKNFKLSLFGNYEIRTSEEYKFAEGLITVLGEVMVGGAITIPDGFSVVTLKKAA